MGGEKITFGTEYYFGELWNGIGDGEEMLESGSITMFDEDLEDWLVVDFDVLERDKYIMDTLVKVTSIF